MGEDSFIEKRGSIRVSVPEGTTCIINVEDKSPERISIKDISSAGMLLLCNNDENIDEYQADTYLNGIYVNMPDKSDAESSGFVFIDKAKIVRSFVDDSSQTLLYGIEFLDVDSCVQEQINSLVNTISSAPIIN